MAEIAPEVVARMEALVRDLVDATPMEVAGSFATEARAIVALLPKPVDADLIEARKVLTDFYVEMGAPTTGIRDGAHDERQDVRFSVLAIKRGRELARNA